MSQKKKKYFWIQLKADFFRQKEIKKLRRIAGGDTYTIIYLKMLLLAAESNYRIYFEGVEDNFAEELALELDEDSDNVKMTLSFLQRQNLIEIINEDEYLLPQCAVMTGSESESAARVRKFREKKKKEQNLLQCNGNVTNSNKNVTTEIEIDIEKDIDKDIDIDIDINSISKDILVPKNLVPIVDAWNSLNLSKIKSIKDNRLKMLNARIKEYGMETVIETIKSIDKSSFLKGQNNRNWIITFNWLIKPNNFTKVMEGNYLDKEGGYSGKCINKNNETSKNSEYNFDF